MFVNKNEQQEKRIDLLTAEVSALVLRVLDLERNVALRAFKDKPPEAIPSRPATCGGGVWVDYEGVELFAASVDDTCYDDARYRLLGHCYRRVNGVLLKVND